MNPKPIIERPLSEQILTVGEYFEDKEHGGIAAVLQYYRPYFERFNFLPSSRRLTFPDKLRYDLGSLLRLGWTLLTDKKIRLVHIHTAAGGSFTKHLHYARLARLMGRRVVLHCHASRFRVWYESLPSRKQARVLRELSRLDRLIVLSQSWKAYFREIGMAEGQIEVLHNITPPAALMRTERAEGTPLRLLFLGEIGPRKGVFDLLEAMRLLKERQPGAFSLAIGGNKREEELRSAIREKGLEDCVCFHGFVSGDKKAALLSGTDVFVLPSYNEGLPISILEAMSYGCAILSTPVGGIPEVVRGNGILVTPGDVSAMAEGLSRMQDDTLRQQMGKESLETVQGYYPQAVLSHLRSLYLSLL